MFFYMQKFKGQLHCDIITVCITNLSGHECKLQLFQLWFSGTWFVVCCLPLQGSGIVTLTTKSYAASWKVVANARLCHHITVGLVLSCSGCSHIHCDQFFLSKSDKVEKKVLVSNLDLKYPLNTLNT